MRGAFKSAAPVLDGEQCVLDKNCSSCQTPSSKFLELFAQFQVLQALLVLLTPQKSPRRPRAFRQAAPKSQAGRQMAAHVSPFFNFWLTFRRPQNSSKFDIVQKPPKTSKMEAQGPPSSIHLRSAHARRPICKQRSFFAAQRTRSAIFSQRSFCSS